MTRNVLGNLMKWKKKCMILDLPAFSTRVGNRAGSPCRNVRSEHVLHAVPESEREISGRRANVYIVGVYISHSFWKARSHNRNFAAVYILLYFRRKRVMRKCYANPWSDVAPAVMQTRFMYYNITRDFTSYRTCLYVSSSSDLNFYLKKDPPHAVPIRLKIEKKNTTVTLRFLLDQ